MQNETLNDKLIRLSKEAQDRNGFCSLPLTAYAAVKGWEFKDNFETWNEDIKNPPSDSARTVYYRFNYEQNEYSVNLIFELLNGVTGWECWNVSNFFTPKNCKYFVACAGNDIYNVLLLDAAEVRELCKVTLEKYILMGMITEEDLRNMGLEVVEE